MMNVAQPIEWTGKGVVMLDQRRLPGEVIRHTYTDYRDVAAAIKDMVIRGAPAIGVAAAMGVALGVERSNARTLDELREEFPGICQTIAQTRPTAVDLFWAVERMTRRFEQLAAAKPQTDALRRAMVEEARAIHAEKRATDEAMGRYGADLMPAAGQVMTHCNAGALATARGRFGDSGLQAQWNPAEPGARKLSIPERFRLYKESMPKLVYLFPDTNVLVQCLPLEQLDWSAWRRLPKMRRVDAVAFLATAASVLAVNAALAVAIGCALYASHALWMRWREPSALASTRRAQA